MSALDLYIGNKLINNSLHFLLLLLLLLNVRSAFQRVSKIGTGYLFLFLFMTIYCMFYSPETGDNYSSMANYYSYLNGTDWEQLHFEKIYFIIMDFVPFGYVYYRFVVWGIACLLLVWLFRKMKIKSQVATLSVLTFALPLLLYYQRAAFAYVLLYVSVFFYISKGVIIESIPHFFKRNYRIFSIVLLSFALPFHSTMSVYAIILLLSLFLPKNKFGICVLVFGLIVFSSSLLSNSTFMLKYLQEDTLETGLRSLENDEGIVGQNFYGKLGFFLQWLPLYCMILYGLSRMIQSPNHQTTFEKICLVNTFILIVISLMFIPYSFTIQIKFRNAAMMPWTLYIASYYMRYVGSRSCSLYALATILTFFI